MRIFNTSGPVIPADHGGIPPPTRADLDDIRRLGGHIRTDAP